MPSATWAFAVKSSSHREKGGRLGDGHDCFECQRSSVGIVTIGDTSHGMPEYFDRRFLNVLVVVGGTGLP